MGKLHLVVAVVFPAVCHLPSSQQIQGNGETIDFHSAFSSSWRKHLLNREDLAQWQGRQHPGRVWHQNNAASWDDGEQILKGKCNRNENRLHVSQDSLTLETSWSSELLLGEVYWVWSTNPEGPMLEEVPKPTREQVTLGFHGEASSSFIDFSVACNQSVCCLQQ